ncbi:MAG: hypothetical protein AABW90_04100 [Nanoarchaeota archaeon]
MDKKTEGQITLTLEIKHLVNELKIDYEYISEELDRWGSHFDYNKPKTGKCESYELVRERVKKFDQKYFLAINAELNKHFIVSHILNIGKEYSDYIKHGNLIRYPTNKKIDDIMKKLDLIFES